MNAGLKKTPIHPSHISMGANMADFAGFEMPLWYETGIRKEHLGVLTHAGIFDTSHMSILLVTGPDAFLLLEYCVSRSLENLSHGRCTYGAFLDREGHCIDDAVVYKISADIWMICVNAGMGQVITNHLEQIRSDRYPDADVFIKDFSEEIAKIDIQGPASGKILSRLMEHPETVFNSFPYFSFKGNLFEIIENPLSKKQDTLKRQAKQAPGIKLSGEIPVLLSRSGYTGEFGFELFMNVGRALELWENIIKEGTPSHLIACGLGARDSLRTGAVLPLSHQDIGPFKFIHHPWEFALAFNPDRSDFTKDFIGKNALMQSADAEYVFAFVGSSPKKIGTGPDTEVFKIDGARIGTVLSCTTDMAITRFETSIHSIRSRSLPPGYKIRGLSCGFIKVMENIPFGSPLVLSENQRKIEVVVTPSIRPDLSARLPLETFLNIKKGGKK